MVLLDHDNLARWADLGIPVRRCAYSVDETRYRDRGLERDVDVGFFCVWKYSPERAALSDWLAVYCQKRGWRYATNFGELRQDYPELLARSKVVVHLNRTPNTRPPRIFDAAACGTAVVASRMPAVAGECWEDGVTYAAFDRPTATYHDDEDDRVAPYTDADCQQIADALDLLIAGGHWQQMGERARAYVLREHTWRVRAQQLHQTLKEAFKL
jgi:glycosyltransferase involved in cell wall biosynthesis